MTHSLRWKHAVGRETFGRCFMCGGAALGGIEGSPILGVVVGWTRNVLKEVGAADDVAESKVWGRDGWLSPSACCCCLQQGGR